MDGGESYEGIAANAKPFEELDRRYEPYCVFYVDGSESYRCFATLDKMHQYEQQEKAHNIPYCITYSNGTLVTLQDEYIPHWNEECKQSDMIKPIEIDIRGKPYCIFYRDDGSFLRRCFPTMEPLQTHNPDVVFTDRAIQYFFIYSNGTENGCIMKSAGNEACFHSMP